MALLGAIATRVLRTAISMISGLAPSLPTEGQLTRRLIQEITGTGQRYQSFQAIARAALRGREIAQEMARQPEWAPRVRELPTDQGLDAGEPRYRYRVLVTAIGADDAEVKWSIWVQSDEPMSWRQLRDYVGEHFDRLRSPDRRTRRAIAALGDVVAVDIDVLSVGVRR